jgi:transcriptional regulator with XRE-family HTH domain
MISLAALLKNRGMRLIDLARELEVDKATVSRWNANGVPHKRLEDVEIATGIPACDIRPDFARVFVKKAKPQ